MIHIVAVVVINKPISIEQVRKLISQNSQEIGGFYETIKGVIQFFVVQNQAISFRKYKITIEVKHFSDSKHDGIWHSHNSVVLPSLNDIKSLYKASKKLDKNIKLLIVTKNSLCFVRLRDFLFIKYPIIKISYK